MRDTLITMRTKIKADIGNENCEFVYNLKLLTTYIHLENITRKDSFNEELSILVFFRSQITLLHLQRYDFKKIKECWTIF